jgi:twitching motility protein PilI
MATKKQSLREFQAGLTERLREVQGQPASTSLLGVLAGSQHWLLSLEDSGEVIPVPEVSAVPLTKPWFCGLTNIRGNLFSVVDFAAFQGEEPTPRTVDSRLLLIGERFNVNSALLVNRMMGLRNVNRMQAEDQAPAHPWINAQFKDTDGRVWKELNVRELVEHPDFLQIGV